MNEMNINRARRFSDVHVRTQKRIEVNFTPKIFNAIKEQILSVLSSIEKNGYEYTKRNLFEIVKFEPVARVIKDLYLKSAYLESNSVIKQLSKKKDFEFKRQRLGIGFDDLAPLIDQYFEIYLLNNSALPITATTRKIIVEHLISEVDRGVPLQQAIENFTELALTGGTPLSLSRAVMIARTESTRAMSFGALIGAYMTGIDVDKVWVTSNDERVRGASSPAMFPHTVLDLQEADMLGSFYNGEEIKFPGDPDASIENVVNCRCAMFFKEKVNPADVVTGRRIANFINDVIVGIGIGLALNDN